MIGIVVAIDAKVGGAETATVDQTGMAEAIGQDQSALFNQGRNDSNICKVTGAKSQRGCGSFELCEGGFECVMRRQRSRDYQRGAGSGPKPLCRLDGGLSHFWVVGQ